jgi:SHS2 domain-containing protein
MQSDPFETSADEKPVFEEIEHTADIALKIVGKSLRSLFIHAALGFNSLLEGMDNADSFEQVHHDLQIDAADSEQLLVQWLSELAFFAEVEQVRFDRFDIKKISPTHLNAGMKGRRFDVLNNPVKAVTYHNLKIVETPQGFETTVVFDI